MVKLTKEQLITEMKKRQLQDIIETTGGDVSRYESEYGPIWDFDDMDDSLLEEMRKYYSIE